MAVKQFDIPGVGLVSVYKRAGAKNLRLSIRSDGSVRVTIPSWSPYAAGVSFALNRADWIEKHTTGTGILLKNGQAIGKSHHLHFIAASSATSVSTRIKGTEVVVTHPKSLPDTDTEVQERAKAAALRALRQQAEKLLPGRLVFLAQQHDFSYKSVTVKNLKTRWGSCDQDRNIVLNLYLMQLPWELIDYVLLHELTHTRIMQHGPPFWSAMEAVLPRTQSLRRAIKAHKTSLL